MHMPFGILRRSSRYETPTEYATRHIREPQKMATRQTAWPSILDSLYLLQGSKLPKPWKPTSKEERDRNGHKERDV
jgi:hypothetical protein